MDTMHDERERSEHQLAPKQYEKLADWGERFALVVFGSLVVQQFLSRAPIVEILLGVVATILTYAISYSLLKKSKL